ncbi:hypothetical protein D9758_007251 [Tetrapyrgos nigripes]|uniref:HMG box domain-containing protein n=1 Tax=Tetrapyrgos nigripes TaxID=182062 RepID=A0A8H5D0U3_9AGAR|nr:hypothetical protein D9758_007251 [Tetrapyrgos nigripes]
MEHTLKFEWMLEPSSHDLLVDVALPEGSIGSVQLAHASTPIDIETDLVFETGTSRSRSRPSRAGSSRRRDPDKPKRPINAYMIFRKEKLNDPSGIKSVEKDNRHISRIISHLWNNLGEERQAVYYRKAEEEKALHKKMYPDWRFTPQPRVRPVVKRNVKRATKPHLERSEKIAKMYEDGLSGDALKEAIRELDEACPIADDDDDDEEEEEKVQEKRKGKAVRRKQKSPPSTRRTRSKTQTVSTDASGSHQSDVSKSAPSPLSPLEGPSLVFRSPLLPPRRLSSEESDASSAYSPTTPNSELHGQISELSPSVSPVSVVLRDQVVLPRALSPVMPPSGFVQQQVPPQTFQDVNVFQALQSSHADFGVNMGYNNQAHLSASFSADNRQYAAYPQADISPWGNERNDQNFGGEPFYSQIQTGFQPQFPSRTPGPVQHGMYLHPQQQQLSSPLHTSKLSVIRHTQSPVNVNAPTSMPPAPPAQIHIPRPLPVQTQSQQRCEQMYSIPASQQNHAQVYDQNSEQHHQSSMLFTRPVQSLSQPPQPQYMAAPTPPTHMYTRTSSYESEQFSSPDSTGRSRRARPLRVALSHSPEPELGSPLTLPTSGEADTTMVSQNDNVTPNTDDTTLVPFSNVLGSLREYGHEYASHEHQAEPVVHVSAAAGGEETQSLGASARSSSTGGPIPTPTSAPAAFIVSTEGEDWSQYFNLDATGNYLVQEFNDKLTCFE